jgi:hypothetical protein
MDGGTITMGKLGGAFLMNKELTTKEFKEFNDWLWDAMKTLRQRYDIQNEHDTISFQAAIDLAQAAWREAAEQAVRECRRVSEYCANHNEKNFWPETCAQLIRERLLDRKQHDPIMTP